MVAARRGRPAVSSQLYFKKIEEARDNGFVEYLPAGIGDLFAALNLTFLGDTDPEHVAQEMERELEHWMTRFPLPLMVFSFDRVGDLISLEPARPGKYLLGYRLNGKTVMHWGERDNDWFPDGPLTEATLRDVYRDVPCETQEEIRNRVYANARRTRMGLRCLRALLILWLVVVPVTLSVLGFASPLWGGVVLVWTLGWGGYESLRLWGWIGPSARERDQAKKTSKMEHYYHHCEKNPEGFLRLRSENITRDMERDTLEEARALGVRVPEDDPEGGRE